MRTGSGVGRANYLALALCITAKLFMGDHLGLTGNAGGASLENSSVA